MPASVVAEVVAKPRHIIPEGVILRVCGAWLIQKRSQDCPFSANGANPFGWFWNGFLASPKIYPH
jgi:hypothetical protein